MSSRIIYCSDTSGKVKTTVFREFFLVLLFIDIRQGDCILSETASLKSVFYVKNGDFELKSGKGRHPPPGEKERENPARKREKSCF